MARASTKRTSPGKRRSPSSQSTWRDRDGAVFDAAVALVEIDVDFDLAFAGGCEGGLDIGLQARLIAFDGEQVVGSHGADRLGDLRIAGDRVDGDHGAFKAAAGGEFL